MIHGCCLDYEEYIVCSKIVVRNQEILIDLAITVVGYSEFA